MMMNTLIDYLASFSKGRELSQTTADTNAPDHMITLTQAEEADWLNPSNMTKTC